MKTKLLKNHKFIIGLTSGLAATTAIVTPLVTSCGNNYNEKLPQWIKDMDSRLGITESTYNRMKADAVSSYIGYLDKIGVYGEKRIEKLNALHTKLDRIDSHSPARANEKNAFGYTMLTSMLLDLRRFDPEYKNIEITRRSSYTWEDLQATFDSYYAAVNSYMQAEHLHEDDRDEILKRASDKFAELLQDWKEQYADDAASAYLNSSDEIFDIFADCSDEISILSSTLRLKQFLSKYSFQYKEVEDKENSDEEYKDSKIDILIGTGQITPNAPIIDTVFNKIFKCINNEDQTPRDFKSDMIPGYIVTPRLNKISTIDDEKHSKYSNQHILEIDWEVIRVADAQKYANDAESKEKLTAHMITGNDQMESGDIDIDKSFVDYMYDSAQTRRAYDARGCFATFTGEKNYLSEIYNFNPTNKVKGVVLEWSSVASEIPCEHFYDRIEKDHTRGIIDETALAQTGLKIGSNDGNGLEPLSEVMERMKDDKRPDEELSEAEKFVKYCNLYGDVTIVQEPQQNQTDGRIIDVTLYAAYKNTCGENDLNDLSANKTWQKIKDYTLEDIGPSTEYFRGANKAYNKAILFFNDYRNNEFKDIETTEEAHLDELIMLTYVNTALTAYYIWDTVLNWGELPDRRLANTCAVALTAIWIGTTASEWALFMNQSYNPIMKYIDGCKEFQGGSIFQAIDQKLSADSEIFVQGDEHGNVDESTDEWKQKYHHFAYEMSFPEARELATFYTTLHVQEQTVAFMEEIAGMGISPKDFKKQYGGWMEGGKWILASIGFDAISTALSNAITKLNEASQIAQIQQRSKEEAKLRSKVKVIEQIEEKIDID